MTGADPFESLPRAIRNWLDAFSAEVDATRLDEFQLLAIGHDDDVRDPVLARAAELARRTSRLEAITEIRKLAFEYFARRYSGARSDPRLPLQDQVGLSLRVGGEERAHLAQSFEDALTAIALSDVLDPGEVDQLLGPWAPIADAAAAR